MVDPRRSGGASRWRLERYAARAAWGTAMPETLSGSGRDDDLQFGDGTFVAPFSPVSGGVEIHGAANTYLIQRFAPNQPAMTGGAVARQPRPFPTGGAGYYPQNGPPVIHLMRFYHRPSLLAGGDGGPEDPLWEARHRMYLLEKLRPPAVMGAITSRWVPPCSVYRRYQRCDALIENTARCAFDARLLPAGVGRRRGGERR